MANKLPQKCLRKKELKKIIANATNYSQRDIDKAINWILKLLMNTFKNNEGIRLRDFGTFKVINKEKRLWHSPKLMKMIEVPARKKVVFRLSPKGRKILNER